MHTETFTEESTSPADLGISWRDATGALFSVQEPEPASSNADALSACDKCDFEL
jgi:hypothetical protein